MKKITTLLFVLFICTGSHAQFNLYWNNTFNYTTTSGFSNEVRKVATDANGNVFVLSDITSDLDSANHVGPTQYYVLLKKFSPSGSLLAQKSFDVKNMAVSGYDFRSAFALEIDATGNVFIGFNKYNSAGTNSDVQVMKYNNALTTAWTFKFATPALETGVKIVLRGSATFLLFKSVNGANTTYSIVRCEPNFISSVPMYSFDANLDVVNSIATTPSLNLFVTGYRMISGVKNVMTASINMAGNLKWKYTFNNNTVAGDDFGTKIIVGTDGFLYVTGTSYLNAVNGNDAMVLRYNAANGTRNAQMFLNYSQGSGNNDNGIEIAQGTAGTMFMAATKGTSDIVVYKLSTTNGVTVNSFAGYKPTPQSYTSLTSLTIGDMKVASSNNVYICGSVGGASTSGNFSASYLVKFGLLSGVFSSLANTDVEGSNQDNFQGVAIALDPPRNGLVRVRSYFSTYANHLNERISVDYFTMGALRLQQESEVNNSQMNDVNFFPNPASEKIYFNANMEIATIEIFDALGKLQLSSMPSQNNYLDISGLKSGIYIAKVTGLNNIEVVKRIIVK